MNEERTQTDILESIDKHLAKIVALAEQRATTPDAESVGTAADEAPKKRFRLK